VIEGVAALHGAEHRSSRTGSRPAVTPARRRSRRIGVPAHARLEHLDRRCARCGKPGWRSQSSRRLMVKRLNGLHGTDARRNLTGLPDRYAGAVHGADGGGGGGVNVRRPSSRTVSCSAGLNRMGPDQRARASAIVPGSGVVGRAGHGDGFAGVVVADPGGLLRKGDVVNRSITWTGIAVSGSWRRAGDILREGVRRALVSRPGVDARRVLYNICVQISRERPRWPRILH